MIHSDRYRVERELGSGGMATVYLAQDLKHQRTVAIKVLRPELAASLGTERFLREIEIAARLDHPHVLPLYDSGESEGLLYYVMPFVEGESLRDRLAREGQLPVEDAIRITREVADALSAAHRIGIIHRDIKPENILLSGGHARVADFGIARALSEAGGARLTSSGVAIGTPAYMSPEQAAGHETLDARSDLYSLGCVLYEMLAGETPHSGPTAQSIMVKRLTEPVPRLSGLRETVSPELERVVHRVLSKAPADRPSSATTLIEDLDRAAAGGTIRRPSLRLAWMAGAVLAAAALGLAALRLGRGSSDGGTVTAASSHLARGDRLLKERTPESFAAAMQEYEAAWSLDSTDGGTLARIGYAHALIADWGWGHRGLSQRALRVRALEFSERALAADSTLAVAWLARAYALAQLDPYRMRGAAEAFERSLRMDSTSAEAWYQYGQALMYMGRDSAASRAYWKAFALDRDRPLSLMSLSAILRKNGRPDEARRVIDTAVLASRTVSSPYVHVLRGIMALDAGDIPMAENEAQLALEQDSTYTVPARSLLVRVRAAEGNRAAASEEMQRVLARLNPGGPAPNQMLFAGAALLALGRKEEMLDLLERTTPRGAQLWFYLRNPEFDPLRGDPRFMRVVRDADPNRPSDQNPP